jgi:hypothetical protein
MAFAQDLRSRNAGFDRLSSLDHKGHYGMSEASAALRELTEPLCEQIKDLYRAGDRKVRQDLPPGYSANHGVRFKRSASGSRVSLLSDPQPICTLQEA